MTALRLPPLYLITPEPGADEARFLAGLAASLEAGAALVQLRAKGLAPAALGRLARAARALCRRHGAHLLVNADPAFALSSGADGVHLDAARLAACSQRPLGTDRWVGASCHGAADLEHAARIGADFAVLSPVDRTASHPGAAPLGWRRFARLADRARLPVYALGGLSASDLGDAWRHGAQGVAAIRGLWAGGGGGSATR